MRFRALLAFIVVGFLLPADAQYSSLPRTSVSPVEGSTDAARYTLSGTVVNSVSGEPIRRALVTLFYQQQLSAMTDSDGHFEFTELPRGIMSVTAQKPGFFSEQELSAGRTQPKQFTVGPDSQSAVIKLAPEAIISGRILDPDGFPIPRLIVRAATQKIVQGRKQWQQGTLARTDADGYYRIINLMPGSYIIVAGPGRAQAFVAGLEDTSELGYPAVSYPGSAPLKIAAGQQVEANITIKPEPFYTVTGSVSGVPPGNRAILQLMPRIPGVRTPVGGINPDVESGTFTLPRVTRGDYTLQARVFIAGPANTDSKQLHGSIPISVRGNLMGVTVPVEPSFEIPINVRSERTKEQPAITGIKNIPSVQVTFFPVDEGIPPAFSGPSDPKDPSSPLVLRNAGSGKYRVEIRASFGDSYVASARLGTTDLLNGEITLTNNASQGTIDIVVRDDGPRLKVKFQGTDTQSGATVLIVPDRGAPTVQETARATSQDAMLLNNLRPGTYTVLAFEDIGTLEYMNRDALEPYLSRGTKITLNPNQEASVTPELIKRGGE